MWTHYGLGLGLLIFQLINNAAADLLTIMPGKEKQTRHVGQDFFVSCESTGKDVQRVLWTGPDGKQITNYSQRIHVEDGKSGQKGVDLVFGDIARKDQGKYTCSANVDGKDVEKSFVLDVYKPISFEGTEKVQYLEEKSDSPVRCYITGDPKPRVKWQYNGAIIRPEKNNPKAKYTQHPEHSSWIVVKNATINDSGLYKCSGRQLSESISELKSILIQVKVRHGPMESSSKHSNEAYSYISGVVNLTCEVIAEPNANFTWLKDDKIVEPSKDIKIYSEPQRSTLQLTILRDEMFGDYYCKAQNRLGILERVVTLGKGVKPSVPTTKLKLIKEREIHIDLSSQGSPTMPITGFKVEYKLPGEEWDTAIVKEFKYGESYKLVGLKDNTLYAIRASSKNAAGYSDPSKDVMWKTKKASLGKEISGAPSTTASVPLCFLVITLLSLNVS